MGSNPIIGANNISAPKHKFCVFREIINLFENGVLFQSENVHELVQTIKNFEINDNNIVSKEIINKFAVSTIGKQYLDFLSKILD